MRRQSARACSVWAEPAASFGPKLLAPIRMKDPSPAATSSEGSVTLEATGPGADASNSVNHSEPVGSRPGRLWTV